MGTNYYFKVTDCSGGPDGLQVDPDLNMFHIGKKSAGWKFVFAAHEAVRSADDWVGVMEDTPGVVVNEYGAEMDPVTFWHKLRLYWCKGRTDIDGPGPVFTQPSWVCPKGWPMKPGTWY